MSHIDFPVDRRHQQLYAGLDIILRKTRFKYLFRDLDAWIRSRLRSVQLKKWKNPKKFQRSAIKSGLRPREARRTWLRMNKWQSINRTEVRFVMNLAWFRKLGLVFLHDFTLAPLKPQGDRRSKSGLPGRYEPFCWEGVTTMTTSYHIHYYHWGDGWYWSRERRGPGMCFRETAGLREWKDAKADDRDLPERGTGINTQPF